MAAVVLDHVEKVFPNGVRAVGDLNLTVADGELVVLLGPSGSGKTTILRMIAGLEKPTGGTIRIGGRLVNDLSPRDRNVAMVFQRHALYPYLTIRGNLAFGLRIRRQVGCLKRFFFRFFRPRRFAEVQGHDQELNERVARAARLLELEEVLDRLPGQVSGGEQQRAALGRALVREPAVFLLDEPLSSLDSRLRGDLRRQLHLLHRRLRATMIYVTHDQVEAMTLGQRIVVLDHGLLQQADLPLVMYDRPRNRFVAGSLGWPPMNFVAGHLVQEAGQVWFAAVGGRWPAPSAWEPYLNRPVALGLRPENVGLRNGEPNTMTLAMEVTLVEVLGSDCLVTCQRGGWQMTARIGGRPALAVGQEIGIYLDMGMAHLFDGESGAALPAVIPGG